VVGSLGLLLPEVSLEAVVGSPEAGEGNLLEVSLGAVADSTAIPTAAALAASEDSARGAGEEQASLEASTAVAGGAGVVVILA
jgi:hypothetical protein